MKQWKKALAQILCLALVLAMPMGAGAANETVEHAYALNDLGLFQGTDSGFELDKRPTRVEGMTMFVRLLGGEKEAKENNYAHPFTDVPKWGDPYVGYAWEKGLTKGTGKGLFGSTAYITLEEYVTFVLRALGYDDSQGDFTWKTSVDKAVEIGLLTRNQAAQFLGEATSRGTMVDVSYAALTQTFKGEERTLAEKLVDEGVFTRELAIQKGVWPAQSPAPSATPETSPKPTQTPKPTDSPRPSETPEPTESQRPEPTPAPPPEPTSTPLSAETGELRYGIVTAENGRVCIKDDVYYSYVVASNGEEYEVCLPDDVLDRGMLVSFAETVDNIYTTDGITVYTEKNALVSWVKEFSERDKLLIVYTDIALDDSGSYYIGQEPQAYAVAKDCVIIYVDAYNKRSEVDTSIVAFDQLTGYKNVVVVMDEDKAVTAIFAEISNECDILP